jgi:hypothetical protein
MLSPPILLRFTRHRRRVGVFHLEPIRRAPRAIGRVLSLRHDALEPELAGVGRKTISPSLCSMCSLNGCHLALGKGRAMGLLCHTSSKSAK